MTRIISNDARLTHLQPIENWLGRLRLFIIMIEQRARKTRSHISAHPDHEIIWTWHRNGVIDPDMRSSLLVGEGHGLPLRISPALPNCPLVSDWCAAEMTDGESA